MPMNDYEQHELTGPPEPKPVCACAHCKNEMYAGDRYYIYDDAVYDSDCILEAMIDDGQSGVVGDDGS